MHSRAIKHASDKYLILGHTHLGGYTRCDSKFLLNTGSMFYGSNAFAVEISSNNYITMHYIDLKKNSDAYIGRGLVKIKR